MSRPKILLVDDSSTSLMMEKMVLNKGGYRLITARDGEEAVAVAMRENPDLILLDVVMPKMDGIEACRMLRQTDVTAETPIIMVTTRGEEVNVERAYDAGCSDFVTKPINSLELIAKVRNYLREAC